MDNTTSDGTFTDRTGRSVTLAPVRDDNWRAIADVAPHDDQRAFVPALAARYLLLSARGGLWTSLGILAAGEVVGHVMWARDPDDGTPWIGGMVIDASQQGRGVGRAAVRALLRELTERTSGAHEIRLSYAPDNVVAERLYASLGFVPTGELEDDEVVAAHRLA